METVKRYIRENYGDELSEFVTTNPTWQGISPVDSIVNEKGEVYTRSPSLDICKLDGKVIYNGCVGQTVIKCSECGEAHHVQNIPQVQQFNCLGCNKFIRVGYKFSLDD